MLRRRESCGVCGYQPICIGGWWTFMPLFCCEARSMRKVAHRKKIGK